MDHSLIFSNSLLVVVNTLWNLILYFHFFVENYFYPRAILKDFEDKLFWRTNSYKICESKFLRETTVQSIEIKKLRR